MEFLRRIAPGSNFREQADKLTASPANAWIHPHEIADLLDQWVAWSQSGLAVEAPYEARARITAASDLMEQVESLLSDRWTHPAAAIVLAGAALEERLRSLVEADSLAVTGHPGLDSYGTALKAATTITAQEAKQVTSWAGLRNQAAHGERLDELTIAEARIMADGINLFLQRHDPTG